jgi:DNA polymerase-3 subunit epsilon
MAALGRHRLSPWPFAGPAWIREGDEVHLIDHWRHLGTAHSEADLHGLLDTEAPAFDRDSYRILLKALGRMTPLAARLTVMATTATPDDETIRPEPVEGPFLRQAQDDRKDRLRAKGIA